MKINKYVSWTNLQEKTVLINSQTNKCLVIEDSGQFVWECITSGMNTDDIKETCLAKYCISERELIESDIDQLIELLLEYEMIID